MNKQSEQSDKKRIDSTQYIDGVYIPKDIEDCFSELNKILDDSTKVKIKRSSEEDLVDFHMGLGRWLRNSWGLWKDSRLSQYFKDMGARHPDDISGIILGAYRSHLNSNVFDLRAKINEANSFYPPRSEDFPEIAKNVEFYSIFGLSTDQFHNLVFHVGKDTITNLIWVYENHFGWKQITQKEEKRLMIYATREKTMNRIFNDTISKL